MKDVPINSIIKATAKDAELLADIGRISFIESHGSSAAPPEINEYVTKNYDPGVMAQELNEPGNIYHIIYHDKQRAGYSKMVLDAPYQTIIPKNVTKLERIYLLKKFYGLKLGERLFNFNLQLSREAGQAGMWLFVWKENQRAIGFYKKLGFEIIGAADFKLTETHSNPNHLMFLEY